MGKKDKAAKEAKNTLREQQHREAIEQDKAAKDKAETRGQKEADHDIKQAIKIMKICITSLNERNFEKVREAYDIIKRIERKYSDQPDVLERLNFTNIFSLSRGFDLDVVVLKMIDEEFNIEDIGEVLDIFSLNLKTIRFEHNFEKGKGLVSSTVASLMVDLLHDNWKVNPNKASDLLRYLQEKGLPFKAKEGRNDALIHALMEHHEDLGFIKMLLDSKAVDINTCITPETDKVCKLIQTPFSVASGTENLELLKLLLEYGADPYLAEKTLIASGNIRVDKDIKLLVFSTLGLERKSEDAIIEYGYTVDKIINDFFLKKLEEASAAEIIKIAQEELPEEISQTEVVELTGPADAELRAEEARTTGVVSESKILDRYIDYKEHASENLKLPTETREEHRFDALVLRYIQTRNEALLESIDEFLSAELAGANSSDYINCLMQMNTSIDDAREVLASNPQLLHKFCTVKKQTQADAHFAGGLAEDLALQEGIYPVPNTKIFLKVSTEFLATLDGSYKEKVLTQLSNPKFIAANSCGISGIKDYGLNISKLKIARTDENLVSFTRYKDAEGNLVIEFDRLLGHKEIDKLQSNGSCTMRDDLSSMIYCSASASASDCINVNIISPDTHPTDEVSLVGDGDGDVEGGL